MIVRAGCIILRLPKTQIISVSRKPWWEEHNVFERHKWRFKILKARCYLCPSRNIKMNSMPSAVISPSELQTRFLFPFHYRKESIAEAYEALANRSFTARDGTVTPLWVSAEPHDYYREEILDNVVEFLFSEENGECRYMRLSSTVISAWFNKLSIELRSGQEKSTVRLVQPEGVELFLCRHGIGILSIALDFEPSTLLLDDCLEFNYRLSQGREQTATRLRIPHPADNPVVWDRLTPEEKQQIPLAPAHDSPITMRLGKAGGVFTLYELAKDLLLPLCGLESHAVQNQFSLYTVTKFSSDVDFDSPETCLGLAPFLSALAQIEEPGHAGALACRINLTNTVLNRRHWTAIGLQGTAHLLADQSPADHPFNAARVPRIMLKYFIVHVMAMMQRLILLRTVAEAGKLIRLEKTETRGRLTELRQYLLEFALNGCFAEVSTREVLHRYYSVSRVGLDVPVALEDARRAISDLDAKYMAESQSDVAKDTASNVAATRKLQQEMSENLLETKKLQSQMTTHLNVVARVQSVVEWLEIFVISVYAADLWHMFGSDRWKHAFPACLPAWAARRFGSPTSFVSWGVLFAAVLGALMALLVIRPFKRRGHS
jgi:hypothetical protein